MLNSNLSKISFGSAWTDINNWSLPYCIKTAKINAGKSGKAVVTEVKDGYSIYTGKDTEVARASGERILFDTENAIGEYIQPPPVETTINKWEQRPFLGFNQSIQHGARLWNNEVVVDKADPRYAETIEQIQRSARDMAVLEHKPARDIVAEVNKKVCEKLRYIKQEEAEEKNFGDFLERGAGVCRHRATLVKLALDEAVPKKLGVKTAIQVGKVKGYESENHAWNVVKIPGDNGKPETFVLDQEAGLVPIAEASKYLGLDRTPLYRGCK